MAVPDEEDDFDPHHGNMEPHGLEPSYAWAVNIPHYYGDIVRQLFLGGAALMLLASPLYATSLKMEFPFEVLGAFLAVGFGALTSPHNRWIMVGNTIIAGTGMVIFAGWGLMEYEFISPIAFVLRLAIAAVCLFTFYFAVKTVRAMSLHQIGKHERRDEFEDRSRTRREGYEIPEERDDPEKRWRERVGEE